LLACETQLWRGQRTEAQTCYTDLLNVNQPLLVRAESLWALGDLQGANTFFQQTVNAEPDNATARVRWGELFYQTYQYQDAYDLFAEALAIDADNAWAHIGAARALRQGGDAEAVNMH